MFGLREKGGTGGILGGGGGEGEEKGYIQYTSDTRYKARVILQVQGDKRTCTLRQIHVYTKLNGFLQGDKCVYTRRPTGLPYTLHLMCTVPVFPWSHAIELEAFKTTAVTSRPQT